MKITYIEHKLNAEGIGHHYQINFDNGGVLDLFSYPEGEGELQAYYPSDNCDNPGVKLAKLQKLSLDLECLSDTIKRFNLIGDISNNADISEYGEHYTFTIRLSKEDIDNFKTIWGTQVSTF